MQNARNKYIPLLLTLFTLSYNSANLYAAQAQPSKQEKTDEEKLPVSKTKLVQCLQAQLELKETERDIPHLEFCEKTLGELVNLLTSPKKDDFLRWFRKNYNTAYAHVLKKNPDTYTIIESMYR